MNGFVYFIQAGGDGPIKIGVAISPDERLKELQIGSHLPLRLLGTIEGDFKLERELHAKLAHLRIRGEWFKPTTEVQDVMLEYAATLRQDKRPDRWTSYGRRCGVCGCGLQHLGSGTGECEACYEFKALRASGRDPFEAVA